jgi:rhodanese-related sulfurtransferase
MREMRPPQLRDYLEQTQSSPQLVDVREPWEFKLCQLPGSVLIPLGKLHQNMDQLDPGRETVVICHHGIRSRQAGMYLERNGFSNVINLSGGVDAWALEIDPNMNIY